MTFWQENYGFVKDVYDFRLQKYQEWMDNLEGIVNKVLSPGVQYTYKEFKIIQDSLTSLTRDLEKDGMKEWLDMMLEKVSLRVSADENAVSSKDKEFKAAEKKKLQALIDRHDKLMPPTQETQAKVDVYARCYAYGDDISQCLKTLQEMHHLAVKDIHPHNMNMVEEQIEKAEKVINTVESQKDLYEELLKRGKKLASNPNRAPFLSDLIEKMELTWKDANEQSKVRHGMLVNASKDWEKYDACRNDINAPVEKLEAEIKKYRKFYDPEVGAKKLAVRKEIWEEQKKIADDVVDTMKKCYVTIIVLAGSEKKEFLDKEVGEVEEKCSIIGKCWEKLDELYKYNGALQGAVDHQKALRGWADPTSERLVFITTDPGLTPEERVREILILQEQVKEKWPQVEPLDAIFNDLIKEEDAEKSETAKKFLDSWNENKVIIKACCDAIKAESENISQDQMFYADYLCLVKDFKPHMAKFEEEAKIVFNKPANMDDCLKLIEDIKGHQANYAEAKGMLEAAGKARESMEVQSATENEVGALGERWEAVQKHAEWRMETVLALKTAWDDLTDWNNDLRDRVNAVNDTAPDAVDLDYLNNAWNTLKEKFNKKIDCWNAIA